MTWNPSDKEDEYFAKQEFEKKRKLEEAKRTNMAGAEKKKLKELHFMKCPKCGMDLIEIDYKNLKIDRCSACNGVWLDSGELEQVSGMEKGALDKLFSVFK